MTAKQPSRVVPFQRATCLALLGSCLALVSACSGSIEETDVDKVHEEIGSTGVKQQAAPTATTPVATPARTSTSTPAATPAAMPAATPAATPAETPAATPAATDPAPAGGGDDPSFESDVWPIFSTGCAPCHTVANLGGQNIGADDKDTALADAKRTKTAIIARLSNGSMPPSGCGKPPGGGGDCISQDDFDTIKAWIDGGTPP